MLTVPEWCLYIQHLNFRVFKRSSDFSLFPLSFSHLLSSSLLLSSPSPFLSSAVPYTPPPSILSFLIYLSPSRSASSSPHSAVCVNLRHRPMFYLKPPSLHLLPAFSPSLPLSLRHLHSCSPFLTPCNSVLFIHSFHFNVFPQRLLECLPPPCQHHLLLRSLDATLLLQSVAILFPGI